MDEGSGTALQIVAVAPGIALVWLFYKRDVHEPEPLRLVVLAVIAGALSVVPTAFASWLAGLDEVSVLEAVLSTSWVDPAVLSCKIGLIEEGMKLLMLTFLKSPSSKS